VAVFTQLEEDPAGLLFDGVALADLAGEEDPTRQPSGQANAGPPSSPTVG
jgi:hypothetical protein